MRWMAILSGLLLGTAVLAGCGGRGRVPLPEQKPADFSITLVSRYYPTPAPDILIRLWADGTGNYRIVFKDPNPGESQGPFKIAPTLVDEVYAAVYAAKFFKLDEEYIADPPIPGRGVDSLTVSAGGMVAEVRSEYAKVPALDEIRTALLKVIPPEAYEGLTITGAKRTWVVDKTTKLIYASDDPALENIPEENRVTYPSIYEALDAGNSPAPSTRPFER
jgi:hypothetical protein